jgi:hypothetical protein
LATLVPLLEAASLQDDPTLAEKWAALLANAADPLSRLDITPVYADILRQLSSQEVKVLDMLFNEAQPCNINLDSYLIKSWTTGKMLNPGLIYQVKMRQQGHIAYSAREGTELDRLKTMIDNFLRQQIIILAKGMPPKDDRASASEFEPEMNKIFFTSLGYDFMKAVTAPAPTPPTP